MSWERKDAMLMGLVPLMVIIAAAGTCKVHKDQAESMKPSRSVEKSNEEPAARGQVKLIFEEHAASWISHDNAFAHQAGEYSKHRGGVVFQLGDYRDFRMASVLAGFSAVQFEGTTGKTQQFERESFFWINLVSADPDKNPDPIGIEDVGQLFLDPNIMAECIPVEDCSGKNCLGKNLKKIPEQCVRQRQIDARYKPYGLITYWQGAQGYDVTSRHTGKHTHFTFTFRDPVTATVYKNREGQTLPLNVGTIAKIFIHLDHDIDHGEVHDPGFGGGLTKGKADR